MSETDDNSIFISKISRDITRRCTKKCFDLTQFNAHPECFKSCFNKYLRTMETITIEFEKLGYDVNSMYAYKCFPRRDPWFKVIFSPMFAILPRQGGYYVEQDLATEEIV